MNTTKHIAIAAALAGLFTMQSSLAGSDEQVSLLSMKPMQAFSLGGDDEHIVGYYLSKNGSCTVHVTQAAEPNRDEPNTFVATRYEVVIEAGGKTRYVSADGHAFELACAIDALAMNVTRLERVASSDKR